jgi:LysM repeat protein
VAASTSAPRAGDRERAATPRTTRVIYRVRRGDTLDSIARAFDTTVAAIKSANRLRSNRIAAGARLTINRTVTSTRAAAGQ